MSAARALPGPRWGAYSTPTLSSWIKGCIVYTFKGEERGREGRRSPDKNLPLYTTGAM